MCLGSYEHLFTLGKNQSGVECRGAWAWVPVWLACPFWTSGRTAQPAGRRAQPLSVCPGCFSYSSCCCWMLTKPDLVLTCKEDLVYGSPGGRYPRRVSAAGQCVRPQCPPRQGTSQVQLHRQGRGGRGTCTCTCVRIGRAAVPESPPEPGGRLSVLNCVQTPAEVGVRLRCVQTPAEIGVRLCSNSS